MSDPGGHGDRHDELAAYALGALDERERARLESHLDECERCRAYLQWLRPAVDVLPASVEQLAPPPRLQSRLMDAVRADVRRERRERRGRATAENGRSWRGLVLRPAVGIAAAIAVVIGGVVGYVVHDSGGGEPAPTLSATLVRDPVEARLSVQNMPQPEPGDVYKVWVQRNGVMQPSTTFVPEGDGSYETVIRRSLVGAQAVAVTEEEDPATRRPTLPAVISASL